MKKKPMVGILALAMLVSLTGCRQEAVREVTRGVESAGRAEVSSARAVTEGLERPAATERLVVESPTDGTLETVMPSGEAAEMVHRHDYRELLVAPTCTDEGYTTYTCDCGDSYRGQPVAALGHALVEEVIPPTASERGYTKHTCTRCQYTYEDTYTEPAILTRSPSASGISTTVSRRTARAFIRRQYSPAISLVQTARAGWSRSCAARRRACMPI